MSQLALFAMPKTCNIEGCSRKRVALGMCHLHWGRNRKATAPPCSIDGCSSNSSSRGWCDGHYQRWLKHGDPLAGKPSPRVRRAIDHPDETRTCCICGERKALTDFPLDKQATRGRKAKCKVCHCAQVMQVYRADPERGRARQRDMRAADLDRHRELDRKRYEREKPQRIAYATAAVHRRRALMNQVEFEPGITVKELRKRHGDDCCYCGLAMTFSRGTGRTYVPTKATIEHIVAISRGGGHTWANTTLACWQCNVRKNAKPLDEWLASTQVSDEAAG